MGRKPIGVKAMSGAERTLRWAERKLAKAAGTARRGAAAETIGASDLKRKFEAEKRALEARVRELERQLAAKPAAAPQPPKTAAVRLAADLDRDERVLREARALVEKSMPGLLAKQKGVWPYSTYRKILACLHTDRAVSDAWLNECFHSFTDAKLLLCPKEKRKKKELSPQQQQEREFNATLRRAQRFRKRYAR